MAGAIAKDCLNQIFLEARTHNKWLDKPVPDELLRAACRCHEDGADKRKPVPRPHPVREVGRGKARLAPHLSEGNRAKTMSAPVCAIIGYDLRFYDHLPKLFPHADAKSWFEGSPSRRSRPPLSATGRLQGAYFIIAARALGLDTGPMSGFDNDGVDREFFAGTSVKSNFLCNLGYGDPAGLFPRSPRFSFDEIAKIV